VENSVSTVVFEEGNMTPKRNMAIKSFMAGTSYFCCGTIVDFDVFCWWNEPFFGES
jgi:hypothetical protein